MIIRSLQSLHSLDRHFAKLAPMMSIKVRKERKQRRRKTREKDEASPGGEARVRVLNFMSHGSVIIAPQSSLISHID